MSEDTSVAMIDGRQQQVQQNDGENVRDEQSETQNSASKLQEPDIGSLQRCEQASIDMHAFLQMISQGQVGAANLTHMAQHNKSESSPGIEVKPKKDDSAGEMIHSLLQRTGLMKKIAERGNAGPCVFAISRHYKVKRCLFTVDVFLAFADV